MSDSIESASGGSPKNISFRIIAASLATIALIMGYNQLAGSMLSGCRETALSGRLTVYVIEDVKWTPAGCRFLSHWKTMSDGTSMRDEARWRSENEVFLEDSK
ncbi:MAG: hypothetical protein ACKOPG_11760 [Novosphingobium sp.]